MSLQHIKRLAEAKDILANMTNFIEIKVIFSFLAIQLLDIDNIHKIYALFILMWIDFVTGLSSAYFSKEVVTSKAAFRTPVKFLVYTLMIITGAVLEKTMGIDILADETIITFLAVTEAISILENFGKLGFKTPNKLLNNLKEIQK